MHQNRIIYELLIRGLIQGRPRTRNNLNQLPREKTKEQLPRERKKIVKPLNTCEIYSGFS